MMQSLIGRISSVDLTLVQQKTSMRFKDYSQFVTPEALILYEQKMVEPDRLLEACQMEYNTILVTPKARYVPHEIVNLFSGFPVVVISYDVADSTIVIGTIPEFSDIKDKLFDDRYTLKLVLVPIYYYVEIYTKQFGIPDFLAELPLKDKWDFIVQEALQLGASDITITSTREGANVYYNVRKKKVLSNRYIEHKDVHEITKFLASDAKATLADDSSIPRYFSVDINKQNRGRVVINRTIFGELITIRVLSNILSKKTLEDLGIVDKTIIFIREVMLSQEKGLRLFVGETMSGKNTTILSALNELAVLGTMKIVSLEQPVEILVDGIEQINAETDEEFALNADSILRQNPDIVYFTEITARTAIPIIQQSNTAKAVFSTLHANNIADSLFRLQDITSMSLDRILLTLHSVVYQELVRDEKSDTVHPYTKCVYFSEDLKSRLFGRNLAEVRGILVAEESRW